MFTAFIAVALELISLTVGALLLLAVYRQCHKDYCGGSITRDDYRDKDKQTTGPYGTEHHNRDHKKCYGFLKSISIFTIVFSAIALIATCVTLGCFLKDARDLELNSNAPVEQYNRDLNRLRKYSDNHGLLPGRIRDVLTVPETNRGNF